MTAESWMLWPDSPALSLFVLALVAMVFLYAARRPVHELLRAVGGLLGGPLRLGARWLVATADEMKERNKAVLLAHGRHEVGQRIEREFERLGAVVRRELQGYPTMEQKILEEIKSSIASIHDRAIGEYRKSYESRHKILEGFLPFWRSVDRNMTEVNKKLT